ncbi:hypothetical protein QCA50_009060 [Cerrena zonata]|uniref:EF-hand domain-containing protein n=1 Tax=Cerrena zonata TaxID=2478898 RepID=A0AAW0GDZ5_9APHY
MRILPRLDKQPLINTTTPEACAPSSKLAELFTTIDVNGLGFLTECEYCDGPHSTAHPCFLGTQRRMLYSVSSVCRGANTHLSSRQAGYGHVIETNCFVSCRATFVSGTCFLSRGKRGPLSVSCKISPGVVGPLGSYARESRETSSSLSLSPSLVTDFVFSVLLCAGLPRPLAIAFSRQKSVQTFAIPPILASKRDPVLTASINRCYPTVRKRQTACPTLVSRSIACMNRNTAASNLSASTTNHAAQHDLLEVMGCSEMCSRDELSCALNLHSLIVDIPPLSKHPTLKTGRLQAFSSRRVFETWKKRLGTERRVYDHPPHIARSLQMHYSPNLPTSPFISVTAQPKGSETGFLGRGDGV